MRGVVHYLPGPMRRVRDCAAIAARISMMFSLSACSLLQLAAPPPTPAPPPSQPAPFTFLAPPPATPPPPEAARSEVYRWFMAHGYKPFQAEALMEHAQTESGFRPCAIGPGGYHYTFQWAGTRLRQLHEFAHTPGCPQLDTQLAFADKELRNESKYACFWAATTEQAAYAALRRGFGRGSC
jgi:hypothetical protein